MTVDEARRILAGDRPHSVGETDAALVEGYRDAMRYVLARADDPHFAWHSELLLAIQHRVMAGSRAAEAGRIRTRQNWVSSDATGEQIYLPPPAADVPGLLAKLMDWLTTASVDPPIAAALGHVALAAIHPFADGNGRTARILASLIMYRAGYQSPQFTSLEEWWGRHVAEYNAAFECLGSTWDPTVDVSSFVEAHVCAQASQADALSLRHAIDHAVWTVLVDAVTHDLGLGERTAHALFDAFQDRPVTNRYYRALAEVNAVTASHDLGKLVAARMLERRGGGRSAHYVATPRLMSAVAQACGVTEAVSLEAPPIRAQRNAILTALGRRLHGEADAPDEST